MQWPGLEFFDTSTYWHTTFFFLNWQPYLISERTWMEENQYFVKFSSKWFLTIQDLRQYYLSLTKYKSIQVRRQANM